MATNENVKAMKDALAEDDFTKVLTVEGVRVRIHPVSSSLIQHVISKIKEPKVPMFANPDKDGRLEENPLDPEYIEALDEVRMKRGEATADAMSMFGIELIDGLPTNDRWIKQLIRLERKGSADLSEYDLEDEFDRELVFKKFIVASNRVITMISRASGVTAEDVTEAEGQFPST